MTISLPSFRQLHVGIVGGGIGGLATAIALRRAGHVITVYERTDFSNDSGASISCPANGTKLLVEWGVDINCGQPIVIKKQIWRDLVTGEVQDILDLSDYADKWGQEYYNFHRTDLHRMLLDAATGPGNGVPVSLKINHTCKSINADAGLMEFSNGDHVQHDLIVGADGIGSLVRRALGIVPGRKRATSTCYHCVIPTSEVYRLGLPEMACNDTLEYWGGQGLHKIVYSACRNGSIQSFYLFFPCLITDREQDDETWNDAGTHEQLLRPFPDLDHKLRTLLAHSTDIRPWRLFEHSPYAHWQQGRTCILGDAAHPMLPDQSQGACQALEDAAALGIIFSNAYTFTADVGAGLQLYEQIRKTRATKVQAASARARVNLSERIGFSSQTTSKLYKVADESKKLTIEEINGYNMKEHIASQADMAYCRPEE